MSPGEPVAPRPRHARAPRAASVDGEGAAAGSGAAGSGAAGIPTVAERVGELRAANEPRAVPPAAAVAAGSVVAGSAVTNSAAADSAAAAPAGTCPPRRRHRAARRRPGRPDETSGVAAQGTAGVAGPGRRWRCLGGCLMLAALAALVTGPSGDADRPLAGARGSLAGERGMVVLACALLAWAGLTCWPALRVPARRCADQLVKLAAEWIDGARDRGARDRTGRHPPSRRPAAAGEPPVSEVPQVTSSVGQAVGPADRTWAARSKWVPRQAPLAPVEPTARVESVGPAGIAEPAEPAEPEGLPQPAGAAGQRTAPRWRWARVAGHVLALGAAACAPLLVSTTAQQAMVNDIGLYALLALGLSVVVGRAGLLDLGYLGFGAIGAYTTAYLCAPAALPWRAPFTISPLLALPAAMAVAALVGFLLGAPILRRRPDFLGMVTLGFGGVVQLVANNADGITGGAGGVFGVPAPSVHLGGLHYAFGLDPIPYYYLLLALVVLVMAVLARRDRARAGRAWAALGEDEVAAEAIGLRAARMRVWAFVAGAAVSGLAGAVLATKQFFNPQTFGAPASLLVLAIVVIGGAGSRLGVVLAAVVLQGLAFVLRDHVPAADRLLYLGALVMIVTALRPRRLLPPLLRDIRHGPGVSRSGVPLPGTARWDEPAAALEGAP